LRIPSNFLIFILGMVPLSLACSNSPGPDYGAQGGASSNAGTGTGLSGAAGSAAPSGGAPSSGGSLASGGNAGTAVSSGGTTPIGGSAGASAVGGASGAGGGTPSGGGGGTDGGAGTGGGGAGGTSSSCLMLTPGTGGTEYCSNTRGLLSSGYSYELWANGQSGCMKVYGVDGNYSASWTEAGDFLTRTGLAFDSTKTPAQIGTISADFAETFTEQPVQGKTSKIYVALYGWTVDPLAEYYIIDDYGDFIPGPVNSDGSPRTNYGTLTVDDGTYDIWAMPVKDRPAITGDHKDFTQIFSVRKVRRKCGHISVSEHFAKWASVGLPQGKLEESMFLMEAQNNSGTINVAATVTLK
jgi:endo-1,4-beta-xylanase